MQKHISKTFVGFGLAAVFMASGAQAQQSAISYDYVEASVAKGEILDEDFTGYGISGSFSINDSVFAKGSYSKGTSDDEIGVGFARDDIEIDSFTFGLGYHTAIGSMTDLVGSLSYINQEVKFLGFKDDANGYLAELGIRTLLSSNIEFEAMVNYVDGSDVDGEFGFDANIKFFVSPTVALTLGYTDGDDTKGVIAGIRFNF